MNLQQLMNKYPVNGDVLKQSERELQQRLSDAEAKPDRCLTRMTKRLNAWLTSKELTDVRTQPAGF